MDPTAHTDYSLVRSAANHSLVPIWLSEPAASQSRQRRAAAPQSRAANGEHGEEPPFDGSRSVGIITWTGESGPKILFRLARERLRALVEDIEIGLVDKNLVPFFAGRFPDNTQRFERCETAQSGRQ
ncbi:hypothetical protein MJC1_02699 [Methylocystis sp. MJC1]|nr:hypothetical protein MJC1_02699 [Methylocystis sp. MJC1]